MKGADEYYDLFKGKSQQVGRLFLQLHTHARGKCFEIFLLPEGLEVEGDRISGRDNVEVYGMTGGQRGWTESYGWLHTGKWKDDFLAIVERKKIERDESKKLWREKEAIREVEASDALRGLLSDYK